MERAIVYYGNKTLSSVAEKVTVIDNEIISLINEMSVIMKRERGIGLAAPQIAVAKRIIIAEPDEKKENRIVLINPEIKEFSIISESYKEGCLSLPEIFSDVIRPSEIFVKGITPEGEERAFEASGLMARIIQHEIDHLDGILFIDRIEKYVRKEFNAELKNIKKRTR